MFRKNNLIKISIVLGSAFLLTILSCKNEVVDFEEKVIGNWDCYLASRNGKVTQTLEGLVFYFDKNKVSHNFFGNMTECSYSFISDSILKTNDCEKGLDLKVESISNDTLVLSTVYLNFDFSLSLLKLKEENEDY